MSFDNTSHPGRPGLDELVPSRYALRVGEIDIMVVSDGVLSLPGAMLGHNADPAVRAAWLEDMFLPPDVLEWALNVVVVPVRLPCGGRRRRLSLGTGPMGVLTACRLGAERGAAPDRGLNAGPGLVSCIVRPKRCRKRESSASVKRPSSEYGLTRVGRPVTARPQTTNTSAPLPIALFQEKTP
jgi:hypothetical protein